MKDSQHWRTNWNPKMNPREFIKNALEPALMLLPAVMNTEQAKVVMMAIAYQESGLKYRAQIKGPAKSYFQFEQGGGVRGVLTHRSSKPHIQKALTELDYNADSDPAECYAAIEHNDILACCFARLLLWTDPAELPTDQDGAWDLYARVWRPGKPHPEKWAQSYASAIDALKGV
jgi:hypothetical protein